MYEPRMHATTSDGRRVLLHADGTWAFEDGDAAGAQGDFRHVSWGMSAAEVRARETANLTDADAAYLSYSDRIDGLSCLILYFFEHGRLVRAKCDLDESHTDSHRHLSDYHRLVRHLEGLHGAPVRDEALWSSDLFRGEPASYGTAVGAGQLTLRSVWETATSTVTLRLFGDGDEIQNEIEIAPRGRMPRAS